MLERTSETSKPAGAGIQPPSKNEGTCAWVAEREEARGALCGIHGASCEIQENKIAHHVCGHTAVGAGIEEGESGGSFLLLWDLAAGGESSNARNATARENKREGARMKKKRLFMPSKKKSSLSSQKKKRNSWPLLNTYTHMHPNLLRFAARMMLRRQRILSVSTMDATDT